MAAQQSNDPDPFDSLLNLEDQYHAEGHALGVADGTRSGRIEGRTFGLEKGFEKFVEMGKLGGRGAVWSARLPGGKDSSELEVPALSGSERLRKHIEKLNNLTDAETLPTQNDEQSVNDFDDLLRDAKAKATLIAKVVGEDGSRHNASETGTGSAGQSKKAGTGEMEDFTGPSRSRS